MKLKSWQSSNSFQCQASSKGPPSSRSGPSSIREVQKSSKRKFTSDGSTERPSRRRKGSSSTCESQAETLSGLRLSSAQDAKVSTSFCTEPEGKNGHKTSPTEDPSHKSTTTTWSCDKPGPSSSVNTGPLVTRGVFAAKYTQKKLLGLGGFGSVYEGYRKDDNLPVAIKHIPQNRIRWTTMVIQREQTDVLLDLYMSLNGKTTVVPVEVALLLKVKPAAAETSAVVNLLDWCYLCNEVILVLERPVPCMDLVDFMVTRGYILQEHEAKVITKQLVDALIELHFKRVFHRDIKLANILIETSSDVPRVRLIDFGCGTVLTDGGYTTEEGTYDHLSPRWFQWRRYKAEPITVWQLGVVLFAMLHGHAPFRDERQMICEDPAISEGLSFGKS
ncbi:hypothetical protein Q5P01_016522 [Channa striata]|uniref:non-specific serine/threonine protein kinase n=1 Tax=Channa striata TaxID=64152 RepID=A0AA88SLS3_CHASR|nr:hypothetical protein Q5P01_016522 [Channa striata]